MPTPKLDPDLVAVVKRLLYDGHTYGHVQGETGVSLGAIFNIAKGRTYQEVPWPDGTKGAIPSRVIRDIAAAKRRGAKRMTNSGDEKRIAAEVEMARDPVFKEQVERAQRMLEEEDAKPSIPTTKVPKYAEYLRKRAERNRSSGEDG